jgi:acetolactate synthase-1/2/3 large subunit
VTVETAESTVLELERSIAVAETPPKGPVRIGIPRNFLQTEAPQAVSGRYSREGVRDPPEETIAAAVNVLASASDPLVVAGGGVRASRASSQLVEVAEQLGAPVMTTYKGKGVFPEDHELFAGILSAGSSANMHACVEASDTALAVGTDLDAVTMQGWSVDLPTELVHVTLHPHDIGTHYSPTVGLVADAGTTLAAIKDGLDGAGAAPTDGDARARRTREEDRELMADVLSVMEPPLTSASAEQAVGEVLPRDAIVSVDAGGFRIWSLFVLEVYHPRGFIDTGSWATMGTGLPGAIGAKVANPQTDVLALTGGGGLLMCLQELHTAADEEIPVTVVVLNNGDYATISAQAAADFSFDDGTYQWRDTPIDFAALAESLGVTGVTAETPTQIRTAVETALAGDEPRLIEVPTDPNEPQAKPID